MKSERNKLMHYIAGIVIILAIIINALGRYFHLFNYSHGGESLVTSYEIEAQFGLMQNILLILPLVLFIWSIFLYSKNKNHSYIPYLLTLVLTFGSIAIISGGSGRVEFHFSIFMVVAALGYYQKIRLIVMMTLIFAVQHILGLLFIPELVFGVSHYMFFMFLLHAIFLILTSSAVGWQVNSGKKIEEFYLRQQEEQRKDIIEDIVGRLSFTSNKILDVSETLFSNTKQSFDASEQLSASMENVADNTEKQLTSVKDNQSTILNINEGIQAINQTTQTVSQESNASAIEANNGSKYMEKLLAQMKEIHKDVDESYETIKELNQRSQAIGNITKLITDIADQTNLLSLNASIEAARAGEHGKGFAVVADEVKKLAEQSQVSSKNISEIIKEMFVGSNKSVEAMGNVKESTNEGLEIAKNSNQLFHHISEVSNEVAIQIQEISLVTEELTASSDKVNKSMVEISESVQQSVSGAKIGILSTNEQTQLTETTVSMSKKLNVLTTELDGVISTLRS